MYKSCLKFTFDGLYIRLDLAQIIKLRVDPGRSENYILIIIIIQLEFYIAAKCLYYNIKIIELSKLHVIN